LSDPSSPDQALSTALIHHNYQPPAGFEAAQPAIHKASTVIFENTDGLQGRDWRSKASYMYGLHGTPTTFTLEARIATLEGGKHTLLAPSGLCALALVDLALLRLGDEVLIPHNAYGPNSELAKHELAGFGIAHRLYDPMNADSLRQAITPATRLVWLEAPGSVTMEFPDLSNLVGICRRRGVLTALDNTWGAGVAFKPFGYGVDLSVQALTKFPSGGADVLMGSVTTCDEALHHKLTLAHMRLGLGVGANDVELVLRSLPTLPLRYQAQDLAARSLANWWLHRPEITAVLHPALPDSPGHAHWQQHCTHAAGLFSVVFDERYTLERVHAFVNALRLFKIGYSWAGPVSLVVPYDLRLMRQAPAYKGIVVRFSLGFEALEDLMADTQAALEAL
jgi:cysteine-S-conjugate beta-lyase